MTMTDPLGDMLTRIRNGQRAGKTTITSPASKLRANVLEVLKREGQPPERLGARSRTDCPASGPTVSSVANRTTGTRCALSRRLIIGPPCRRETCPVPLGRTG